MAGTTDNVHLDSHPIEEVVRSNSLSEDLARPAGHSSEEPESFLLPQLGFLRQLEAAEQDRCRRPPPPRYRRPHPTRILLLWPPQLLPLSSLLYLKAFPVCSYTHPLKLFKVSRAFTFLCQNTIILTCRFSKVDALEVVCEQQLLILLRSHQPLVLVQTVGKRLGGDRKVSYCVVDTQQCHLHIYRESSFGCKYPPLPSLRPLFQELQHVHHAPHVIAWRDDNVINLLNKFQIRMDDINKVF